MPKEPTATAIRSRKYRKKLKDTISKAVKFSQALQLYDSSIQDTKEGNSGSTLVHFTYETWKNIGYVLKDIMIHDKKLNKESLFMVKFLDVGGGLCTGLCSLPIYYKVSALSIKMSPQTFKGSLIHLENAKKVVSISVFH